jgi:prophage regulatory protein
MSPKVDPNLQVAAPSVPAATSAPLRILRLKEVCKTVGLGRSFVYRLQTENRFPHSIKIGVRAVGWLEEDIRKWLAERIADSRRDRPM